MVPNPNIMQAVEKLGYRVTVGDVASQAGLDLKVAEQGVLALASATGGHLQVSDTGEIAYLFPRNFRSILRNQSLRLRLQETWGKIWRVLFYLIRVSFGILLIASIALIMLAITVILIALNASRDGDDGGDGGMVFMPNFWFGPDFFWIFTPDYRDDRAAYQRRAQSGRPLNFLEAIFSFLFGDGNPNAGLEERRWQTIAAVIRTNGGAVTAEQIAPYLDDLGQGYDLEYESYMLPVLSRFNGRPEVSPTGEMVYHFPELQVTATQRQTSPVAAYLKEALWRFSQATAGQIMLAIGLGTVNIVGALVLGSLLRDSALIAQIGGLVAFVGAIYPVLLVYGGSFLAIPLIRYFWLQGRNAKVETRNDQRQERAALLQQPDPRLQQKLRFAQQFAAQTFISQDNLAYTTETDLTEQELAQADKIDAEWRRRLSGQ